MTVLQLQVKLGANKSYVFQLIIIGNLDNKDLGNTKVTITHTN